MNNLLIHQLFELQKNKTPDAAAIIFGDTTLTYAGLAEKADNLAGAILAASPDSLNAGVSTHRAIETIVSVLAILKSGKSYLPLDPEYPKERLQQIATDSKIDLCLSLSAQKDLFESLGISVLASDKPYPKNTESIAESKSACYVLYTSGSTGTPKGVSMGHAALANLLQWQQKESISGPGVNTLQFAPLTFDVSFQEIFATLTTGGTLVLVDEDMRVDPSRLLRYISDYSVNRIFLPFVVLQYLTEAADAEKYFPACLQEVITAGEQLKVTPQVVRFFSALPGCVLFNQYGPTETHVVTQLKLDGDPAQWQPLPNIGIPIDETEILILDEELNKLPYGETGELCVAGVSLADGYLNRPDMTAEKFVEWKESADKITRIYRTGDLARYLPDGNIEYLGRRDTQVKIRGNRVEIGEIEVLINQLDNIKQAVVIAREDVPGQKRLVAYMISANDIEDSDAVRKHIEQHLPDFMWPSAYVWVTGFPKTTSGKVDRKALPKPDIKRPELSVLYKAPSTIIEKNISNVWVELLLLDKVGMDDNFFLLGGNSILAMKTVSVLKNRFGYEIPITKLYQFPTVGGMAGFIGGDSKQASFTFKKDKDKKANSDIAIIGMAGRFPGANNIDEFWDLLIEGREGTSFFSDAELDKSISPLLKQDSAYVKARGVISGADEFDAAFFGFNPRSAELMDPQQRVFLEIAWEALETTGYLPQKYSGSVGVFAGCGYNTYFTHNVLAHPEKVDQYGQFNVRTLNEKDYIATRTAYQLNLKGPAVAVYSACSTSSLAIAQAVSAIRDGQCDVALAGAASVTSPIKSGHLYEEGSIMSKDGHCRPFDAEATGTVFSDGAGVVLLKSREDAERDGDTIYAIIKGIGINNDGADKGSFGGPSAQGQAGAIAMALNDAGVNASTITYIEAHGTATPLGDPIEIEGLNLAFGIQEQKQYCAIGSVKSNFGHLTAASGVAGLIKTVLSLQHRKLVPSLFYQQTNPNINLTESPFFVNNALKNWEAAEKRRAGVSSFGVGGTNVHIILEEFEQIPMQTGEPKPLSLITWSAKTETSTNVYAQKLAGFIEDNSQVSAADIAATLQNTRTDFNHRRFVIAANSAELLAKLKAPAESLSVKNLTSNITEVVFMFPGQGSQYINMGKDLYDTEPVFAAAVDECIALLQDSPQKNIFHVIYPQIEDEASAAEIKNTFYTQPAIFIMEYAMAKLWMSWGIQPSVVTGHSIGEFVAAHFAGIFSLKDALMLISTRAKMVSEVAKGSMLSVRADAEKLQAILPAGLSIAAVNSNKLCVVAGPDDGVAAFAAQLEKMEIPGRLLHTSHAFHSAMMDSIVSPFEEVAKSVKLNPPVKPIVSTVTGTWMTEAEATNPQYWANHLRKTVRFAAAVDTLQEEDGRLLLEVGPGTVLATLAKQQISKKNTPVIPGFEKNETLTEYYSVLRALGTLWLNGLAPDWKALYHGQQRLKLNLPAYAFDKKRYWLDAPLPVNGIQQHKIITEPMSVAPIQKEQDQKPLQNSLMRKELLTGKLKELFEDASGIEIEGASIHTNFIEIGFDSLLLTQIATNLKKEFNVPITFRKLFEEYNTINSLAAYLDTVLPANAYQSQPAAASAYQPVYNNVAASAPVAASNTNPALDMIQQQIQMLASQLAMMQTAAPQAAAPAPVQVAPVPVAPAPEAPAAKNGIVYELTAEEQVEVKKPFGATARIEKQVQGLSDKQTKFLADLTKSYNDKTPGSKAYTQEHRDHMADPRVVSGFRPLTKEIVYPLVVNRSKGSRVWDIDGNEYVDALNGFGSNFLGYQVDVLKKAVLEQVENGYEIGPQHVLAGDVCRMIAEFTNFDRAAVCNTGSEAVLGAMRIARTVTGRTLMVAFSGSYHGINDEVIVRGTRKLKTIPAAPGIMPEVVQNMLILDYGTEESLRIIAERAHELAAVLVEPVQSRRPDFHPIDFLKKVRQITEQSGACLIFDEVITGFRMHPGGAQAMFGIKADLGTYGKVIGGGMPIGAIAGIKKYMDALDGGTWQYGDDSQPEAGVTYFAGTFVRHPLALAAAKASLQYMKDQGPALQEGLNKLTAYLAGELNAICESTGIPLYAPSFGSLWKIKFKEELPYGELLFTLMRNKGIHIWDLFPCFLTASHTKDEVDAIIAAFRESVDELIESGFFPSKKAEAPKEEFNPFMEAPYPGARLGRDKDGNPGWFIVDSNNPGKYLQVK
ncbi:polyketide synthase [Mucilaginibacter sp. L3T2-6]|uniref:polyketide synthase n=1 Tax=Mucilaginibacter sp. L3T2-6 TaxID=3062491 RepID=UPI002674CF9F|nr:polyketide synthase [Mucilaginibacter sp. L3T2-6]MDO3641028.1 amino acid adenylation domain-containing protein [Mucilaginibacter sp. L3T2-6]MDV6213496.1 amino acid adenylation domain-containing protein [Mucilaginibacter sp. L3T2-6]